MEWMRALVVAWARIRHNGFGTAGSIHARLGRATHIEPDRAAGSPSHMD